MNDLIKREDAIGAINGWLKQNGFPNLGDGILYLVPSADRPRGELKYMGTYYKCSACGSEFMDEITFMGELNYCPACGADVEMK